MSLSHMTQKTQEAFIAGKDSSSLWLQQDHWIEYSIANKALKSMEKILASPARSRMPNLLLFGESNNGKTAILNHFCNVHPPDKNPGGDHIICPVLKVEAPPKASTHAFLAAILNILYVPYRHNDRFEKKIHQVETVLKQINIKVLIIDEVHNLLAGTALKQQEFRNLLKYLSNTLQISIIAAGTSDALNALSADPQIRSRFTPFKLDRWQWNEEYFRLIKTIETHLPLPLPSNLVANESFCNYVFERSEQIIGEIIDLIREAALLAVEQEAQKLTYSICKQVDRTSPSMQRQLYRERRNESY